jgi:hypothetical protein
VTGTPFKLTGSKPVTWRSRTAAFPAQWLGQVVKVPDRWISRHTISRPGVLEPSEIDTGTKFTAEGVELPLVSPGELVAALLSIPFREPGELKCMVDVRRQGPSGGHGLVVAG